MEQNNAIQRRQPVEIQNQAMSAMAMNTDEIKRQLVAIQNLMRDVMKPGVHFGQVPGCGEKPMLFKPGAELIGVAFQVRPDYKITVDDLGDGHKNFDVTCALFHIPTGNSVGMGVGSCSTMESKYRYRNEVIGDVPGEYWDSRDPVLLGGSDFEAKKMKKVWKIVHRVPVGDIADVWNTCLKMAKKRAHGDAIQSSTAASDMFEGFAVAPGDVIDETSTNGKHYEPVRDQGQNQQQRSRRSGGARLASDGQCKAIYAISKSMNISNEDMKCYLRDAYSVGSSSDLTSQQASTIITDLKENKGAKFLEWDRSSQGQSGPSPDAGF